MKTRLVHSVLAISLVLLTNGLSQGKRSIGGGNGFDSGDINVKPADQVKNVTKKVKVIRHVAVCPDRQWKSADKKKKPIKGCLLAFKHDPKSGKVQILKDGKVRMLIGKKDMPVGMDKLSADDQIYIQKLVDAARDAGKLIEEQKPADKDAKGHGKETTAKEGAKGEKKEGEGKTETKTKTKSSKETTESKTTTKAK